MLANPLLDRAVERPGSLTRGDAGQLLAEAARLGLTRSELREAIRHELDGSGGAS